MVIYRTETNTDLRDSDSRQSTALLCIVLAAASYRSHLYIAPISSACYAAPPPRSRRPNSKGWQYRWERDLSHLPPRFLSRLCLLSLFVIHGRSSRHRSGPRLPGPPDCRIRYLVPRVITVPAPSPTSASLTPCDRGWPPQYRGSSPSPPHLRTLGEYRDLRRQCRHHTVPPILPACVDPFPLPQ